MERNEWERNSVVLYAIGSAKIAVIKVVRELTGLGLKDAKELVEQDPPVTILSNVPSVVANEAREKLALAGAAVETGVPPSEFSVVMHSVGPYKINVIKVVRELTMSGLKEAKDLVESELPVTILAKLPREAADQASHRLTTAGAETSVRQSMVEPSKVPPFDPPTNASEGGPIPW